MPKDKKFITKDSGVRQDYPSGMRRDTQEGKPSYDLCYKPMYRRWAEIMERGAQKYGRNNWQNANSIEELERFLGSLERHLMQFINATKHEANQATENKHFQDVDLDAYEDEKHEDHAAAIYFNVACAVYVLTRLMEDKDAE